MIALALVAVLAVQDTNAVPPRVRAMLDHFPPPRPGNPSIAIRFSRDTVWIGEQVELITATWFPRPLRDRLRHLPVIRAPSLSGLWSARNQQLPIQAATRFVGNQVYDLYIMWQTIFPLGAGTVDAPPAVLSYGVPTSTAYFAPEERKTFLSAPAKLVVRAIPPALAAEVGPGPVAQNLHVAWRGPASGVHVALPVIVELVVSGEGNLALWPTPQVTWPRGLRVYPEATEERATPVRGFIAGEKRFRYTVVADSAAVFMLPAVSYPYFDPSAVAVRTGVASAFPLVILPRSAAVAERGALPVTERLDVPFATVVVRSWWAALLALAGVPILLAGWRHRRRSQVAARPAWSDAEVELRAALGTPLEAGPDHVVAALRVRGVAREDAEHIHRWLSAAARRRYGPNRSDAPPPPPAVNHVLLRLRQGVALGLLLVVTVPFRTQATATASSASQADALSDAVSRYNGGDYPGAARAFETEIRQNPAAANAWRDLGAARWMMGDDVAAAAAWIQALRLAPRDPLLRADWRAATTVPPDVRALSPRVPVSRDELLLGALLLWMVGWTAVAFRWRRTLWTAGALLVAVIALGAVRWRAERPGQALLAANSTLRISPHPATMAVPQGDLPAWTRVQVERRDQSWLLVSSQPASRGSLSAFKVEGWVPVTSVAPIGPLD